jgi:glutamate decarboxylase
MAIYSKEEVPIGEQVFGTSFLPHPLPKYKFPQQETAPNAAYQLVHDELLLDGPSRQNMATFCQTWVEPEVQKLMDECLGKNLIDKDEYPQTAEIESRCVNMLSDLWNSPDAANSRGCSTSGSSEAAMLGGLAMKGRWREKRRRAGKSAARPNLICGFNSSMRSVNVRVMMSSHFGLDESESLIAIMAGRLRIQITPSARAGRYQLTD